MKTAKLLASAAMCLGLTGFAGHAHAEAAGLKVIIDCFGANGLPTWSETGNTISIYVYVNGFPNLIWAGPVSNAQCNVDDGIQAYWGAFNVENVDKVLITTTGSDSFWMDHVSLVDESGGIRWGVENNVGFCLSTDSFDGGYSYCYQGKALPMWTFTP